MKKQFDYLVVGAGPFGAVFAHEAHKRGKSVLVIDRRNHIAGNLYCESKDDINIHVYGAHIFHTSLKHVWDYVNQFAEFNHYVNSPVANYKGEMYNLPFNMNTFSKMWNIRTPKEAQDIIIKQRSAITSEPKNLEEQAISLVGTDIYEKLIKGYTEKQWGRKCTELPAFIIKRLPVRYTYDNNYFNDIYQGIPIGGYTKIIEKMLENIEVRLNCNYFDHKEELDKISKKIIFTGQIDQYYDYRFGRLEYRSLRFETTRLEEQNYQGNAVVNYTEYEVPYTRIIEHKHFEYAKNLGTKSIEETNNITYITKEYPADWQEGMEPYYPINNEQNNELYQKYLELASKDEKVIFGGRLGMYKYFDMDKIIEAALECVSKNIK